MSSFGNRCGCGETSASTAMMNTTISAYRNVPTVEIEQNIFWLKQVKCDCDNKIRQLRRLKKDRERSEAWRDNLNAIAQQFCDPDSLHLSLEDRIAIIRQRLDCSEKRVHQLADIVHKWAKRQIIKDRNKDILYMRRIGFSVAKIAKKKEITRQQVYNVLNANKVKYIKNKSYR